MIKLEDFLLPPNLVKQKEEFIQEIDAIIADGGISDQPLSLDEVMKLESKNYPNAEINEGVKFGDWVLNTEVDDIPDLKNVGYEFHSVSKDEIEEERLMSELGFKDWVQGIEDEEHYVDHEETWKQIASIMGSQVAENLDKEILGNKLPDYLLNDAIIVGYPDEETQREIYLWVARKMNSIKFIDEFSVKDLGCGRGDFYKLIQGWTIDYIGIDSNPNLIQVGQKKYPEIKLINSDFNEVSIPTDFTICIGTLNDDHNLDKWEFFNKTLNHALNNTKTAIIFVLQADCYGEPGHLDYPIRELVEKLPSGTRFEIDNSKFEDIYCLTVHVGQF
jgi:hypothetical protein